MSTAQPALGCARAVEGAELGIVCKLAVIR